MRSTPVHEARMAIMRLFEEGHMDANMATAGLLAVDLGARRGRDATADEQAEGRGRDHPRQGDQP
jgi:hypothetical protein